MHFALPMNFFFINTYTVNLLQENHLSLKKKLNSFNCQQNMLDLQSELSSTTT